jgi:ferritin-like metal-binding protein YciE
MSSATDLIIDQLREAEAVEQSSISLLESHLRGAPPGPYRAALRRHLDETRRHAHQVAERLQDLGASESPLRAAIGLGEAVVGRVTGLALAPLSLLSSRSSPDVLLRHLGDDIAAEAREVAVYEALERLADAAGDAATSSLARAIRADEERALQALQDLLDPLADRVARRRLGPEQASAPAPAESKPAPAAAPAPAPTGRTNGGPVHTERETPYRERAERRKAAKKESQPDPKLTREAAARVREAEREAEQADIVESEGPAAPGAEIHVDAPWEGYDDMKATEIVLRLRDATPAVRAMARLYEETNKNRRSILDATS